MFNILILRDGWTQIVFGWWATLSPSRFCPDAPSTAHDPRGMGRKYFYEAR